MPVLIFAALLLLLFIGLPIFAALGGLSMVLMLYGHTPGISIGSIRAPY